ncbi:MAG TPA: NTP transferase domain-containing protein [Polyangiales bacterium]|nr:NTP transferase domain-containing protein [Polyangiales bacterium]
MNIGSTIKPVLGVFVGGRGERMGRVQKALLLAPGGRETLLTRTLGVGRAAGLEPVLVGAAELGEAAAGLPQVMDHEPRVGPLSGLSSLLDFAGERPVIAVACDMPRLDVAVLQRLLREQPQAVVLAPRDVATGKWHPLCTRYAPAQVRPVLASALERGARSFQALFRELSVVELAVSEAERSTLDDWDSPEDMA